ncbi:MAG: family 1 glycosylhydrolase [Spiroplasma phoeniceum]|nr:MAG: family 1 glycosylhydrolase [Spiroplasma phoeniceum]UZQ31843.1 MAG: family 1 glycosylhydrolase [Spiroplasma phoeniceum]
MSTTKRWPAFARSRWCFYFYAKTCFELFGDRVQMFATFNEPIVVIEGSYWYVWHFPNES